MPIPSSTSIRTTTSAPGSEVARHDATVASAGRRNDGDCDGRCEAGQRVRALADEEETKPYKALAVKKGDKDENGRRLPGIPTKVCDSPEDIKLIN
jgi:hypothetical protein